MSLRDLHSANAKNSLSVNKQNTFDKPSFSQKIDSSSIFMQLTTPQITQNLCLHGPSIEPAVLFQLV